MAHDASSGYLLAWAIVWRIVRFFLMAGGLVFWSWLALWVLRQETEVTVIGSVVDAQTGKRVPNAKVVVSTWHYSLSDSSPTNYGTLTNAEGEFRIHANPGYWIAWFDVSASTPDNKYVQYTDLGPRNIGLVANPLRYNQVNIDASQYVTFQPWGREINWQE